MIILECFHEQPCQTSDLRSKEDGAVPIYEYQCDACGAVFEVFQSFKDKPLRTCTHCKARKVRKLVSHCSFQLKGSGWYVTDYARKDNGNGNGTAKKKDAEPVAEKTTSEKSTGEQSADSKKSEKKGASTDSSSGKAA